VLRQSGDGRVQRSDLARDAAADDVGGNAAEQQQQASRAEDTEQRQLRRQQGCLWEAHRYAPASEIGIVIGPLVWNAVEIGRQCAAGGLRLLLQGVGQ